MGGIDLDWEARGAVDSDLGWEAREMDIGLYQEEDRGAADIDFGQVSAGVGQGQGMRDIGRGRAVGQEAEGNVPAVAQGEVGNSDLEPGMDYWAPREGQGSLSLGTLRMADLGVVRTMAHIQSEVGSREGQIHQEMERKVPRCRRQEAGRGHSCLVDIRACCSTYQLFI